MANTIQIEKMTRREKLQTMEALWASLSVDDQEVVSPAWHEHRLRETDARVSAGQEQTKDWTKAKQELRKRFE
ncbi:MAG: addiction module protein [Candidatus Fermentibacteria bacterium]|nr:addiction module protein [Candidatus Fermentibacteria bacterium]